VISDAAKSSAESASEASIATEPDAIQAQPLSAISVTATATDSSAVRDVKRTCSAVLAGAGIEVSTRQIWRAPPAASTANGATAKR
jgi:hypothetical protein